MRCLEERCFSEIVKSPQESLAVVAVERAFFSERATQLVRRSTDLKVGRSEGIDTVRLRQRIITKLIDEGRGMPGSFPAPPAFLDDSFTAMSLANSKVGDSFIRDTLSKRCPMLRSVDLTACFYIRDGSIEALLQRCPYIERLSLRNCRKLTDLSMEHVVRHGKKIVALDVGGCFNLTAAGVDSLCTIHPNTATFTELDVSGIAVTTHTLELICKHCRNIRALRVGFIEYMEATLTLTLVPLAPKLHSLHVHWNTCVTDDFLAWAVKSMPRLQDINLCGCSHISMDGVSDMLYERKEALANGAAGPLSPIEKVNVRYTSISKQDVEALQGAFEGVEFR